MSFDDTAEPPLVFANQVIKMLAEHVLGEDAAAKVKRRAYRVIRIVFRKLGGSWMEVCSGSPKHTDLLIKCVTAWGDKDR
jgi:hypothetical protein